MPEAPLAAGFRLDSLLARDEDSYSLFHVPDGARATSPTAFALPVSSDHGVPPCRFGFQAVRT